MKKERKMNWGKSLDGKKLNLCCWQWFNAGGTGKCPECEENE